MLNGKRIKLIKYKQIVTIMFGMLIAGITPSFATEFNADVIMNKMTKEQRTSYLMGLIDGLAYSRWQRDKPDETGMQCIYNWYLKDTNKLLENKIIPMFKKYKDKPATAIFYVLIKRECGT
uniref:Rap1a immunity protein domain-containing protein n=1 Tax=OCS116 cluster bacterium TaxID=2030921 RepID=A0A2A4Z266_9PROT